MRHPTHLRFVIAVLLVSLSSALPSYASASQPKSRDYQVATPSGIAAALRAADRVVVTLVKEDGMTEQKVTVRSRDWIERCAKIIEACSFDSIPHCFCVNQPQIEIHQADRQPLRIALHGKNGLQFLGRSSGKYAIGTARRDAIRSLLDEQELLHADSND